jgi:uncharacterized protein DUF6445
MQPPFITKDNFLRDPEAIRALMPDMPFQDIRGPDHQVYKRVAVADRNLFNEEIKEFIGAPVAQRYSVFRLNFNGEDPNSAIHTDAFYDSHALVLYLSRPEDCAGGTAFWRHKKTGFTTWPSKQEILRKGKNPQRMWLDLTLDWDNLDAWEQTHLAEMKYNRAICYSTTMFHSRYPFKAFGNCPENGRLIFCSFFTPTK